MKNSLRVLLFAFVVGLVCAGLLVGASLFTAPYREANQRAEEVRNYLAALGVPVEPGTDARSLVEIFNREVSVRKVAGVDLYEYESGGQVQAVAVPFAGPGLWGPIRGVIALEPDLKTIRDIRFYEQEETPGLGGEIGTARFQNRFEGKLLVSESGNPGFTIVKPGSPVSRNSIEGISGATMTSDRVQVMLDGLAQKLQEVREQYGR